MIYLDYNATAPLLPEAMEAMKTWWQQYHANPSAIYQLGRQAKKKIDHCRHVMAALIGCADHEVIFTGGGTESNNMAVLGLLNDQRPKQLIISAIEHSSIKQTGHALRARGWQVDELPVDDNGLARIDILEEKIDASTGLVSIMAANNEHGVIQPVNEISRICRKYRVPFHCDAVQLFGRVNLPWTENGLIPDLITLSAHKMGGPTGVGLLINRLAGQLEPLFYGGKQEFNLRPGTENGAAIFGWAAVVACIESAISNYNRVSELKKNMEQRFKQSINNCIIAGEGHARLPNTSMVIFPGVHGTRLLRRLDDEHIQVGLGSACQSGTTEPSYVLKAMGIDDRAALCSVRISMGPETTEDEINLVTDKMISLVKAEAG